MRQERMETGRWYPENDAERAHQAVGNAILGTLVGLLYFALVWGLLIGF